MISFGIITAPRPRSTIESSLASLRLAGFDDDVVVSSDDADPPYLVGCSVTRNSVKLGNLRNWHQCLTLLLRTGSDWLCVCEDDITWVVDCRDALEYDLRSLLVSSRLRTAGALSLYFPIAMSRTVEEKGVALPKGWHATTRGFKTWGAQCFLFTRQMALDLLGSKKFQEYVGNPRWSKNVDGVVAESIAQDDLRILYRVPCLVNHDLGDANSSLGYADSRPKLQTRYFTGAA